MIEAAGGVVWRVTRKLRIEVLVVHRPRREDWSLPKGKLQPSETHVACALREVREETGLRCALGDELPSTEYFDRKGRAKSVRYWAMQARGGQFRPNREVDRIEWSKIERVGDLLSYDHDLVVVEGLATALVGTFVATAERYERLDFDDAPLVRRRFDCRQGVA